MGTVPMRTSLPENNGPEMKCVDVSLNSEAEINFSSDSKSDATELLCYTPESIDSEDDVQACH